MPPLASICIPTYNSAGFIGATLDSVLAQTHRDFEVIVTDDRSTDETVSVVKRYSDPRIRLVQNHVNLGIGENWNKALSLAEGKYVKLMGGDDLLYPDCINRQIQALENAARDRAVLAICNSDIINCSGKVVLRRGFRLRKGLAKGQTLIRNCVRWGTNLLGEPVVGLFKREILARSGMYDASNPYWLDLMFWAELLKQGDAVLDCDRLAAFRVSATSVTTSLGFRQAAYTRTFINKMRIDPFYRTSFLDRACGKALALPRCILRNFLINSWNARKT